MKSWKEKPGYELASPAGWTMALGVLAIAASGYLAVVGEGGLSMVVLGLIGGFGLLYLVVGGAAWQEKIGAVKVGMWLFTVVSVLRLASLPFSFSWSKLGTSLLFVWLAWEYRTSLKQMEFGDLLDELGNPDGDGGEEGEADKPMISIVLLLDSPRYLEDMVLAGIVEEAWGGDYTSGDEDAQDGFVVGEAPVYVIKCPHGIFMVNQFDRPYFDEVDEVAEEIGELRLRRAILEHQAWLSVDLMVPVDEDLPLEDFYPLIIRLIYELAGDDVLAVLRPETGQINVWDDEVLGALLKPDGIEQFNRVDPFVPVVPVADDDPAMKAAVAEARERWPEFAEAFAKRGNDDAFSVKAPVTVGGNTEFIWIEVTGLEPEYIHGKLGNEPVALEGLQLGSVVEVPVADLNDWFYAIGEAEPVGLFTVKVVQEAQDRFREEREREREEDT